MERFPLKKRFPGLRLVAFVVTSLVGATAAFVAPIAVIASILSVLRTLLGEPIPEPMVIVLAFLGMGVFGGSLHLLGRLVTGAGKLRAPWGDLLIGRDGISFEGLWGRRFLPWSALRRTKATREDVRLRTTEGASPTLGVDDPKTVHRIVEQALVGARVRDRELRIPDVLKGSDPKAWLAAVRALGVGGYRQQAVTDETLIELLEDPATPPLPRLGAAVALAKREPARVRVVLDDMADDETRAALQAALEGEPTVATVKRLAKRS